MPRTNSTVIRGRFSIPSRGVGRDLMFNPNTIDDSKAISWGSAEIPGASHPVYQYGAGGERLITFELYIDGDRGRFGRQQTRNVNSLSIKDELYWYRSFVYPGKFGGSFAEVYPYIVLFTFGEMYQNVPCIVKKADWKINTFTRKLEPVRATIPIQLAEVADVSQTSDDMLKLGGFDVSGRGKFI